MAEVTNELVYEILKTLQSDMSHVKHALGEVRHEIASIRLQNLGTQNDVHNIYGVTARIDDRLDRIERRLELRELAETQKPYEPK